MAALSVTALNDAIAKLEEHHLSGNEVAAALLKQFVEAQIGMK